MGMVQPGGGLVAAGATVLLVACQGGTAVRSR